MKGEKKRLAVTAADLVIVIVLLALAFFTYEYVFEGSEADTFELDYVVKVSAIRSELADRITVGDEVYSVDGAYMGRVTAYEARAAVLGTTGQTLPDRSDLYITIEVEAEEGRYVSGVRIYVECELQMFTKGLSFEGVCINVRG